MNAAAARSRRATSSRATRRSVRSASISATCCRRRAALRRRHQRRRPPTSTRPSCGSIGPAARHVQDRQAAFAQAAIGQGPVAVTPLQMALVAEAVATGGVIMPAARRRSRSRAPTAPSCARCPPKTWKQRDGPGHRGNDEAIHDRKWCSDGTGTAPDPGHHRRRTNRHRGDRDRSARRTPGSSRSRRPKRRSYAIAVLVEHGGVSGTDDEATGGRIAAPVAAQVLTRAAREVTECNCTRVGGHSPCSNSPIAQ